VDGVLANGVHSLDALSVGRIDNGRDVEEDEIVPPVEANLAEHARDVLSTIVVGVPVADPASRKDRVGGLEAFDHQVGNLGHLQVLLRSEDDDAGGAVLVDEVDRVFSGSQ